MILSACVFLKGDLSLAAEEDEGAGEAVAVIQVGAGFSVPLSLHPDSIASSQPLGLEHEAVVCLH